MTNETMVFITQFVLETNPLHYGIASGTELCPRRLYLPIRDDGGMCAEPVVVRRI